MRAFRDGRARAAVGFGVGMENVPDLSVVREIKAVVHGLFAGKHAAIRDLFGVRRVFFFFFSFFLFPLYT